MEVKIPPSLLSTKIRVYFRISYMKSFAQFIRTLPLNFRCYSYRNASTGSSLDAFDAG